MDIDGLETRIEEMEELLSDLKELERRADELFVDLDQRRIASQIDLMKRKAAILREAEANDLKRAYERMSL